MREKRNFVEQVRRLAPDIEAPDHLWDALGSSSPTSGPNDAQRRAEVLAALLAQPQPASPMAAAIWREFALLPLSSLVLAAVLSLAMVGVELLAPPLVVRGHVLVWMGLAAPWLGMLWGLTVAPARKGPWADWQAIAPLRFELRMTVRLGTLALVSLLVAALLRVGAGAPGTLVLSWLGPFMLGAVLMVALAWRWGAAAALAASALAWGIPVSFGLMSAHGLLPAGSTLVSYVLASPGSQAPQAAMLALSIVIAMWMLRRSAGWRSN